MQWRVHRGIGAVLLLLLQCLRWQPAVADDGSVQCGSQGGQLTNCVCSAIGGQLVDKPVAPLPTCRVQLQFQGRDRFADVYFPSNYSSSNPPPLWLELHGLYRATWSESSPDNSGLNHLKRAAEHTAQDWGIVTGPLRDAAIHVYPDSTATPPGPQLWNCGFWPCPYNTTDFLCVDESVDDVGFLELITKQILQGLPTQPGKVYLLGFSNGGMMAQTLVCQSDYFRRLLSAVALVDAVLAQDYLAANCTANTAANQVPMVFIHGLYDELFPFKQPTVSATGTPLYSAESMVIAWATKYGCLYGSSSSDAGCSASTTPAVSSTLGISISRPPLAYMQGTSVTCRNYCPGSAQQQQQQVNLTARLMVQSTAEAVNKLTGSCVEGGKQPLLLCGLEGASHAFQTNRGELAWTIFTKMFTTNQTPALPEPKGLLPWYPSVHRGQQGPLGPAAAPGGPHPLALLFQQLDPSHHPGLWINWCYYTWCCSSNNSKDASSFHRRSSKGISNIEDYSNLLQWSPRVLQQLQLQGSQENQAKATAAISAEEEEHKRQEAAAVTL